MKKTFPALVLYLGIFLAASVGLNAACYFVAEGAPDFLSGRDYEEDFQKVFPLQAGGSFSLKNTNGDVHVSTWTKDEVEIKAVKIAKRRKEDLDRVRIDVEAGSGFVKVDTIYEKHRNLRVEVNYEIKVPESVRLDNVRTTNGDIELVGRFADAEARSTNGDVRLESASGRCVAHTTNGKIYLFNVKGPVEAETTNGSIHIDLQAVEAAVRADTTNGSITLKIAGEVNADLRVHTVNGHIKTDFPVTVQGIVKSRRSLDGTLGKGGPEINLKTVNGSVNIIR